MDNRRTTDGAVPYQNPYWPPFYYRRRKDKILIFVFISSAITFSYFLIADLKEFNITLATVICLLSLFFASGVRAIANFLLPNMQPKFNRR